MNLKKKSVGDLGRLYRQILAEFRDRGVIRTGNAPVGDYAEWLVQQATKGTLAPNSQKSWDVETRDGRHLQVKSRFVVDPSKRGQRQLSPFRSWDFSAAVIVLFDDDFRIWKAAAVPEANVKAHARYVQHVNGYRVAATDELLGEGEDWTARLARVADRP